MAAIRPRRWLSCLAIAFFPLALLTASWALGQIWLAWLAMPFALLAVRIAVWNASRGSRRTIAPRVADSRRESSPAACVGLAVSDGRALAELVREVRPFAEPLGEVGPVRVARWQDASGIRLVMETTGDDDPELIPSFAARTRVVLRGVRMLNDEVATAMVVDEKGEPLASMAVLIEQRRLLPRTFAVDAVASIVALGTWVSIHGSAEDFAKSDASLLLGSEDAEHWRLHPDEPPAHYVERGEKWPRRAAAESFGSYAVFLEAAQVGAGAQLSGMVLSAERRTVVQTGQQIIVADVQTAGFNVTLCLEAAAHAGLPAIGGIISGSVLMVASMDTWHYSASEAARRASLN